MQPKIEHFYNEKAANMLRKGVGRIDPRLPQDLRDWLTQAKFYDGYFLGPRTPRDSVNRQITRSAERLDDFSVEIMLNKLHLEDNLGKDLPPDEYIMVYFDICDHFARHILKQFITKTMLLWYSTDAFEADAEFPSHTMSFGFPRSENDYYYLDVESRTGAAVGTQITITQ